MMCHGPFRLMVVRPGMFEISGEGWSAADATDAAVSQHKNSKGTVNAFMGVLYPARLPNRWAFHLGSGTKPLQIPDNFHRCPRVNCHPGLRLICRLSNWACASSPLSLTS